MVGFYYTPWIYKMSKVSLEDVNAIAHINYVTHTSHDLVDDLYEDLMERDHSQAKIKAQNIVNIMSELVQSLSDDI